MYRNVSVQNYKIIQSRNSKGTVDLLQELLVFLSDQSEPNQNNQMCVTCDTHRRGEAPALNIRRKSQATENTLKR